MLSGLPGYVASTPFITQTPLGFDQKESCCLLKSWPTFKQVSLFGISIPSTKRVIIPELIINHRSIVRLNQLITDEDSPISQLFLFSCSAHLETKINCSISDVFDGYK